MVKNQIRERVASYADELADFTRSLIEIPTENPPGRAYGKCIELITAKLRQFELDPNVIEVHRPKSQQIESIPEGGDSRYCILADFGEGQRTLYFHGHYDVVPASSADQFSPRVEGGKLIGRGSADMKGGIAAMIYAVRALADCSVEIGGKIGLAIVPDEETGGQMGCHWLSGEGLLGRDGVGMLTPEPTSGVVWNGSRGAISLRVTVRGTPAHVALEHEGVNAFERALVVAGELMKIKTDVSVRKTDLRIEPDAARHSILMLGGECRSGANFNTVPERCSFTVDRRINPEEDLATEKQRLFSLFDRLRQEGIDLDVEIFQEGDSSRVGEDSPLAEALSQSIREVTGESARFELCPGLLETRFYSSLGIPALGYGPGLLSISHGPDEYVEIQKLIECATIYALTAIRMLGA